MVAGTFPAAVGRYRGSQWHFWTMEPWMATWYLGEFSNFPMAEREISANACQRTCGVSWNCAWQWIKRGAPPGIRQKWQCPPLCTSINGGAIMPSSWPRSSFEVVTLQIFCGLCGYIPHVCRYGQRWMHRNAAQIPGFTKSLCIRFYTYSWWNWPKSYTFTPCSNISDVLGIELAAAGICMSCPGRANLGNTHMVTEYNSWWLW